METKSLSEFRLDSSSSSGSCHLKPTRRQKFKKEFKRSRRARVAPGEMKLSSTQAQPEANPTIGCSKLEMASDDHRRRPPWGLARPTRRNVIWPAGRGRRCGLRVIILTALLLALAGHWGYLEALRITNFRVPSYVPITLPTQASISKQQLAGSGSAASGSASALAQASAHSTGGHPMDLAKPILFDCDYDYKPDEDARLTVRWFRNKEPEPFYQWLPELGERHLADWIRPLVNQSFVSDPLDPKKRYRSLLIKRLSMNLTGHYACVVSSLANQDTKQASLVVYQPPQTFTFKQTIYPAPAPMPPPIAVAPARPYLTAGPPALFQQPNNQQNRQNFAAAAGELDPQSTNFRPGASPTQFKGYHYPAANQQQTAAAIIRPPNNNSSSSVGGPQNSSMLPSQIATAVGGGNSTITKIVYTHDGRPIRRKSKRQASSPVAVQPISGWMLRKRLGGSGSGLSAGAAATISELQQQASEPAQFAIQLHHFQCQATQVTPRPVILLSVKRGADSIAQYLHESSTTSIRPYQVNHADYFESTLNHHLHRLAGPAADLSHGGHLHPAASMPAPNGTANEGDDSKQDQLLVTLYDITVSATVALNVSLQPPQLVGPGAISGAAVAAEQPSLHPANPYVPPGAEMHHHYQQQQQFGGVNTVLSFRRGQRMSFECHLEITGTEFEQRKRININEEEVYQFAEAEERKRKLRLQQVLQQHQQERSRDQTDDDRTRDPDQEASLGRPFASSHANGGPLIVHRKASHITALWTVVLANLLGLLIASLGSHRAAAN